MMNGGGSVAVGVSMRARLEPGAPKGGAALSTACAGVKWFWVVPGTATLQRGREKSVWVREKAGASGRAGRGLGAVEKGTTVVRPLFGVACVPGWSLALPGGAACTEKRATLTDANGQDRSLLAFEAKEKSFPVEAG